METSKQDAVKLEGAGFTFEYPGFWAKWDQGFCVTIADGLSCNGHMWEVQTMNRDMSEVIATCDGPFSSADEAIAQADEMINAEVYGGIGR